MNASSAIAGLSFDAPDSAALEGTVCWETTSVELAVGGDHGCLGVEIRLCRFLTGPSRNLVSPSLALGGVSVIFAATCCDVRVGDTGDPRRGCDGIPRADARLLAIEDASRLGRRVLPTNLGGGCASWFAPALFVAPASAAVCWVPTAEEAVVEVVSAWVVVGCSCWNRRISASFLW